MLKLAALDHRIVMINLKSWTIPASGFYRRRACSKKYFVTYFQANVNDRQTFSLEKEHFIVSNSTQILLKLQEQLNTGFIHVLSYSWQNWQYVQCWRKFGSVWRGISSLTSASTITFSVLRSLLRLSVTVEKPTYATNYTVQLLRYLGLGFSHELLWGDRTSAVNQASMRPSAHLSGFIYSFAKLDQWLDTVFILGFHLRFLRVYPNQNNSRKIKPKRNILRK